MKEFFRKDNTKQNKATKNKNKSTYSIIDKNTKNNKSDKDSLKQTDIPKMTSKNYNNKV